MNGPGRVGSSTPAQYLQRPNERLERCDTAGVSAPPQLCAVLAAVRADIDDHLSTGSADQSNYLVIWRALRISIHINAESLESPAYTVQHHHPSSIAHSLDRRDEPSPACRELHGGQGSHPALFSRGIPQRHTRRTGFPSSDIEGRVSTALVSPPRKPVYSSRVKGADTSWLPFSDAAEGTSKAVTCPCDGTTLRARSHMRGVLRLPGLHRAPRCGTAHGCVPPAVWRRIHPSAVREIRTTVGGSLRCISHPEDIMARSVDWAQGRLRYTPAFPLMKACARAREAALPGLVAQTWEYRTELLDLEAATVRHVVPA